MRTQSFPLPTKETHSKISSLTDIPPSPTTPGSPTKPGVESHAKIIELLHTQPDEKEQNARLTLLGYTSAKAANTKRYLSKAEKKKITEFHEEIALKFNDSATETPDHDQKVLEMLMLEGSNLQYLFARGSENETVLHVLLNPETYLQGKHELLFHKLKPLLRFLLKICPELPTVPNMSQLTPLFCVITSAPKWMMKDETTANEDRARTSIEEIIRYICGDEARGGLGSVKAIESLATKSSSNSENHSLRSHALHRAIESSIEIDEDIVKKLETIRCVPVDDKGTTPKSCLEALDDTGKTCLHLALTRPFTPAKDRWTKIIVKIKPDLLKAKIASNSEELNDLTPFQFFMEEKRKQRDGDEKATKKAELRNADLKSRPKEDSDEVTMKKGGPMKDKKPRREKVDLHEDLEGWLKLYCLREFDNATARSAMYKPGQMRETYLGFDYGDTVSGKHLMSLRKHYRLDTTLRWLYIPPISVKWDNHSITAKKIVDDWKCVGRTDLFMIFDWLKVHVGVQKVVEVVVEDFEEKDRRPHSDQIIEECLRGLKLETWNWKRMDISSELIFNVAEEHVKVVHLYCSGINAVLRSWSDRNGLAKLKRLETVNVEINQGLESYVTMTSYAEKFKTQLENSFRAVQQREIKVNPAVVHAADRPLHDERQISKMKELGEDGYEEQDWLKCMDRFADLVEELRPPEEPAENHQHATELSVNGSISKHRNIMHQPPRVKVAIIDDGVKSSIDNLDDIIAEGESLVKQASPNQRHSPYITSSRGHGTVMAYYIRRVCPTVRLYVAKLNPQTAQNRVTFTIESATEAINWAVRQGVDIISMSWAIEKKLTVNGEEPAEVRNLREALGKAAGANILLFCAHPDKGPGEKNTTYPKNLDTRIFCIGAANKDGNPWGQIGDKSSDFYLPGVDLGIPTETSNIQRKAHPPEEWKTHSGSSLSCALAVGLAAQILYCAQLVEHKNWQTLKTHDGMKDALELINVTENRWLPVGAVFGADALYSGVGTKARLREEVVDKLCAKINKPHPQSVQPLQQ